MPVRLLGGVAHGTLALGTAQLGLSYGVANSIGQPSFAASREIVRLAIEHGVTALDTARAYGSSEAYLGEILSSELGSRVCVITKLSPLAGLDEASSTSELRNAVDASVFRSCRELRMHALHTLLLHRFEHRCMAGGAVWLRLIELKAEGVIGRLGASVDTVADAIAALEDPQVAHLQIPFNILDHRWQDPAFQASVRARPDVVVHARSPLLQGILAASSEVWPRNGGDAARLIGVLEALVARFERADRTDLCLAYARAQDWITSVVIGVESEAQLLANLRHFGAPALTAGECAEARAALPMVDEQLLNPSRWQRR